jgi:tRNA pseudouridine38-40 synthase
MKKFKLTIAYDGTQYGGWQNQPNAVSIQTLIEQSLSTILRLPTEIIGSGRTDAGVHALGQAAHFCHSEPIDLSRLRLSLNALLPQDIRIRSVEEVDEDFHARYSAIGKTYHYHLHLDPISDPFRRFYSTHVRHPIDLALLKEAAKQFIGTKDFTSFANEAHEGSASKNAVRTLHRLDVIEEAAGLRLEFEGNGFLYKMVRNIVGTLLDIARGQIPLSNLQSIFDAKDRRLAGRTAPPEGLFLVKVHYSN